MNFKKAIATIDEVVDSPTEGLPEEVFLLVSRISPLINVDLLIRNKSKQTLLTWREDGYHSAGWHIPGGIIRYKETIADRIRAVAKTELGADVESDYVLEALTEYIHPTRRNRGHGISLLYECKLTSPLDREMEYRGVRPKNGEWAWHDGCPDDILSVHEIYRKFIEKGRWEKCRAISTD
ncbi:MAG: NUDIX domain-containing protein [Syntrophaceae bacterium]|nr:NUDIX domain-containing protein [Syntrophaceae bacterium]